MRGRFWVMCLFAALVAAALVVMIVREGNEASERQPPVAAATAFPTATAPSAAAAATGVAATATATVPAQTADTPTPAAPALQVNAPRLLEPTTGLANTRAYYAEAYVRDIFTIRWRPGAFPPERADEVAAQARQALDHDNQLLGTDNEEPLEIILADQLFDTDCFGCQGFAAADLRQIFLLQDGSVAPDEFQMLIAHEIGHVLAYDYIAEPRSLFFAEGFATWAMKDAMVDAGYIGPEQTAAWALKAGVLPTLDQLRQAQFAGRVRARVEYDGAEAFTQYVIETYGLDAYERLYSLNNTEPDDAALDALGVDWTALEMGWHAWLGQWADNEVNGVDANQWWSVFQRVGDGFQRLYDDPESVTAEQYAALASSRVALNRGDLPNAIALVDASRLAPTTAS